MTTPATTLGSHRRLQPTAMGTARWTEGFWGDRFKLCHETSIPAMKEALEHPENSACLSNFRVGAGLEEGAHRGTNWSDGDCYKWIEAMAHAYAVTKDPELDREMDHWIDLIGQTQCADGYISTQTQLNPKKERWGRPQFHE
ncbi:MAG: glycoside hydrolase family 127 protein, partial [Victivallales bacterium]|nr:glycoside hydrolase family 127 protein [Victivallales bacterium]